MEREEVKEYLRKHGVKPSVQRMAIMEYLMEHRTHPTVETIFNALYPSIPTLSKTTVYNTLKLLVANEAIQVINIDEKNARYDADTSIHAHFKCKCCSNIVDLPIEIDLHLDPTYSSMLRIEETQVYCSGTCAHCMGKH